MSQEPDRYAVIGHPVDHSRSPAIHAAFAEQTGEAVHYGRLPAAPEAFAATAADFFAAGGAGLNVTLPFKQQAAAYADELNERARRAGAVNTLTLTQDGRILGDNTDGLGLLRDLSVNMGQQLSGARILILGAGGAVRGVVPMLLDARPAQLTVANRSIDKASAIAGECAALGPVSSCSLTDIKPGWDIVINAISAGLSGDMPDLPDTAIADTHTAYDMIYAEHPTPFMRWAESHDVTRRRDGFGMLVEQAAESFLIWRGVRPDTAPVIRMLRPGAPGSS